jgi:hypothetical protein
VSTYSLSIPLGSVDLDRLKTDDDFRREARRLLPDVLTGIGEKSAEVAWNELQKSFRGIPGFKGNSSSSDKSRFIREAGQNHRRNANDQDRRAVEDSIIEQLREMKCKAG